MHTRVTYRREKLHIVHAYVTSGLRACGCRASTILSGSLKEDVEAPSPLLPLIRVGGASVAKLALPPHKHHTKVSPLIAVLQFVHPSPLIQKVRLRLYLIMSI